MTKTTNYNLNKPEAADPLRVADFNENADKIDGLLKQVDDNSVTRSAQVRSEAANALAAYKTSNDAAVAAVNTAVSTKAEQSAVDALTTTVSAKAQVAVGSYTGTGTYGTDNPTTLTFEFEPKMVMIWTERYKAASTGSHVSRVSYWGTTFVILLPNVDWLYISTGSADYCATRLSFAGNRVEYYNTTEAACQWNTQNTAYHYLAIG